MLGQDTVCIRNLLNSLLVLGHNMRAAAFNGKLNCNVREILIPTSKYQDK